MPRVAPATAPPRRARRASGGPPAWPTSPVGGEPDAGRDAGGDAGGARPLVFDAYRRDCPSHAMLKPLASRWVVLVVSALAMGRMRHSELARKVEGATPKMLTQTLRELERDGLVRRRVMPTSPPRVDYVLTASGRDLARVLRQFRLWSERRAAGMLVSRARLAEEPLS